MSRRLTSSFVTDIEAAILAEIMDKMGTGTDTYPEHPYLQMQYAGRVGGMPEMDLPERFTPAFFMQYLAGGDQAYMVGAGQLAVETRRVTGT